MASDGHRQFGYFWLFHWSLFTHHNLMFYNDYTFCSAKAMGNPNGWQNLMVYMIHSQTALAPVEKTIQNHI
jgi:hypothetical protein